MIARSAWGNRIAHSNHGGRNDRLSRVLLGRMGAERNRVGVGRGWSPTLGAAGLRRSTQLRVRCHGGKTPASEGLLPSGSSHPPSQRAVEPLPRADHQHQHSSLLGMDAVDDPVLAATVRR